MIYIGPIIPENFGEVPCVLQGEALVPVNVGMSPADKARVVELCKRHRLRMMDFLSGSDDRGPSICATSHETT